MFLLDAEAGSVGATITRYCVWLSACDRPRGMKVWVVKGCLSRIWTSNNWRLSPSLSSWKSMSPQLDGMESEGSFGRSCLGLQTNMFITAFAGFLLGAKLYRFERCVTSRILSAEP
jgi:hypothetical protein